MRKMMIMALAATAVAAPAAMAQNGDRGHRCTAPIVSYEFVGTVNVNAGSGAVELKSVRGINRHARRALEGATTFTVKLGTSTRIRTRVATAGGWSFVPGTYENLLAGDRVRVKIRARKGTLAASLPEARKVMDFTPNPPPPPAPVPTDPSAVPTPGTVIPPGVTPPTLP